MDATGFWLSTADNNAVNPETDTTGAWVPVNNDGVTTLALTNANVTLTAPQYAKKTIILTGAITSNVQIIFPAIVGIDWTVINNTTGAFTITCKTGAGTGVAIGNGAYQNIYSDGTNVVFGYPSISQIQSGSLTYATDTGTANAYAVALSPAPTALTPGMTVGIDNIAANNTGAATLNVNALGAIPIQSAGGVALQGGELVATYGAVLRLNHAGTAWVLLQSTGGSLPVKAGTQSEHAVNLGQLLSNVVGGGLAAYVDVTSLRAIGTVYTNTSGHPLDVHVTIYTGVVAGNGCRLFVDGSEISQFYTQVAASTYGNLSATVPEGATYEVNNALGTNTQTIWKEL